jgi:chromate transporter
MMEDEVVRRRAWVTRPEFLDLLGATNLIPGPNSTEMAIHLGYRRAGWRGLILAGSCFILPAFLIVLGCAWAYVRWGALPVATGLLYAVKPVIIAIVAQAVVRLARTAIHGRATAAVAVVALVWSIAGVDELIVLFGAGAVLGALAWGRASPSLPGPGPGSTPAGGLALAGLSASLAASPIPFGLAPLFLFFLKVGSVLFGSGYVLVAFLRGTLVQQWGWLTEGQLLDAIAVGQVTPGPVFTTATFIGYALGGLPGAVLATAGIFIPAFVFVALSGPLVPRLRRSPVAAAFLDGVNAASMALMAVVTVSLGRAAIVDAWTAVLVLLSLALLVTGRLNSAWLILAAGLLGAALRH